MTGRTQWPQQPVTFEINTAVWLAEVAARQGRPLTLADVPSVEWDAVVPGGVNVVWLMGVWARSLRGRDIALANLELRAAWSAALPGWTTQDVAGSPYCIRSYEPEAAFGGWAGLDEAREQLRRRGAALMVDWVPNHVAPESAWLTSAPEAFVRGTVEDLQREPTAFVQVGDTVFACGKDPYFPAWSDVVQVNAFAPGLRELAARTLTTIAEHADAVRCDMAMLMLDDVVSATWGDQVGPAPARSYWTEVMTAVRAEFPQFRFVAEAYWDREWDLQQLGFDYCYDKRLYDRLKDGDVSLVRDHLGADAAYQQHLVRFLENHDEPRATRAFAPKERVKACVVAVATLPGLTLWHEGQQDGRTVFVPVFLRRRATEAPDSVLADWYQRLRGATVQVRRGTWGRCDVTGWPDNRSAERLVAWRWTREDSLALVVVNLSAEPADGIVYIGYEPAGRRRWRLVDLLEEATYERDGDDLAQNGLYVSRAGWGVHVLDGMPLDDAGETTSSE